jgi:hypothetical protein
MVVVAFAYQPFGFLVAGPCLPMALMLVPGRAAVPTREERRKAVLHELQAQGLAIRAEWRIAVESPLSDENSRQRAFLLRSSVVWMAVCNDQLRRFPELGGIFEAEARSGSVIDELNACIATLSRLRRLVSLSEKLDLPI